jgi:glycosyltransferase involved in cell wall biosynthesis
MVNRVLVISPNSSFGGAATANLNIAHMIHIAGIEVVYNDEFITSTPSAPFEFSDFPVYANLKNKESLVQYIKENGFSYVLIGDGRIAIHYFFKLWKLKRKGIRIGIIFHSLNIGKSLRNKVSDWMVSVATLCANDLLYVSNYTQASWNKYLIPKITKSKGRVIYNAVKAPDLNISGYNEGKPNIVFVGRFSPEKRPSLFCEIAKIYHKKYNFIMWGNGPQFEELNEKYQEYVRFKGYGSDISSIYDGASLIVVPSVFENCPMCILESMARGIPSICTRVGGIPEIVSPGANGEFLAAGNFVNSFDTCAKKILGAYDSYQFNCIARSKSFLFENISKEWKNLIEGVK